MRQLPRNRTKRHNRIIQAVDDFFGDGQPAKERWLRKNIALWIMNRKKGIKLNDEQKEAMWYIKSNLSDPTYREGL